MTDGKKITEYDEKDDGSQYNWLLHNQLCDAIVNQIITIVTKSILATLIAL